MWGGLSPRSCPPPSPPSVLAGSAGRGRHRSPWVVCYGSQLPPSPERFRRRVTHELECAKPPANRASCPRPRRGGRRGESSRPHGHGTAQHGTAPCTRMHGPDTTDARPPCVLPGWAAAHREESRPLASACPQHRQRPPISMSPLPTLLPSHFLGPGLQVSCTGRMLHTSPGRTTCILRWPKDL